MTVSAADSPLLQTVRRYLEQRGLEIVPAPEPFKFSARYPNNPTIEHGILVVEAMDQFTVAEFEQAATAASSSGVARVMLFADADFPTEISQKALQLCVSLIDRTELRSARPESDRPKPPRLPTGHHVAPEPRVIVYHTHAPAPPKPKQSFIVNAFLLLFAILLIKSAVSIMLDQVAENKRPPGAAIVPRGTGSD